MSYDVLPYAIEQLVELLAREANSSPGAVGLKQHKKYFETYFIKLGARTIVAEFDYIDHDYLEDYSSYYVKCFYDYHRKCARLHFFQESFTREEFSNALSSENPALLEKLKNTYLGFIVVKPLPKTIIGRTCLKTYPVDDDRFYPNIRRYSANLFGIDLEVKTLAYQEQDSVAAACATSALWSVFHGTGMLFHHAIPSPIEITKAALEKSPAEERNLPNKGLNLVQLGHAIRDVGLDPYLIRASNEHILKSTAYGYLRAGVPIYFSINLFDTTTDPHKFINGHGVAITGYKMDSNGPKPMCGTGLLLKSSRIEKFYVHDDQIGPFARMEFDDKLVKLVDTDTGKKLGEYSSLSTSFFNEAGRAVPKAILVPLYHKIRIPYDIVHDIVLDFDTLIEVFRPQFTQVLSEQLEWDIFLSLGNDFKSEILGSTDLSNGLKENVLIEKMPKYLWRAIGSIKDKPMVEFVFDATDIEQGNVFLRAIRYDNNFHNLLCLLSKAPQILLSANRSISVFHWYSEQEVSAE
ncbi:MAG: hypothetical protein KAT62_14885 [Desulfuromonadales bacterium]|nr:hypothetical protein [Desulfuromonadales bacterium]